MRFINRTIEVAKFLALIEVGNKHGSRNRRPHRSDEHWPRRIATAGQIIAQKLYRARLGGWLTINGHGKRALVVIVFIVGEGYFWFKFSGVGDCFDV